MSEKQKNISNEPGPYNIPEFHDPEIQRLALTDPIVHHWLSLYLKGQLPYHKALELMVRSYNTVYTSLLTKFAQSLQQQPPSYHIAKTHSQMTQKPVDEFLDEITRNW